MLYYMDYISVLLMDLVLVFIVWVNYIIVLAKMNKNKNWLRDNITNYFIGYLMAVLVAFLLQYFYETFA
jgi:hypothetical protein